MFISRRIGPAEIIAPGIDANIAKDGAAVAGARLAGSVDVVHELMVVEREEARYIAMPLSQLHAAAEIELVIFPHADDRGHHFDASRQLLYSLHQSPRLGRIRAQL